MPEYSSYILFSFQLLEHHKSFDLDDQEIFINFKPAPVSPDARALLSRISEPTRRFLPLQKTFSDGEIRVERRELIGETGEPSYPHTCIRNHQDPWGRTVRAPVQFSSTPEDLSLLRIASPHEDHHEEVRSLARVPSISLSLQTINLRKSSVTSRSTKLHDNLSHFLRSSTRI